MPPLPSNHPVRPPASNSPSLCSPTSDPPASLSEWGSINPFLQSSYANGTSTSRYSTADSGYYGSSSSRAGGSSSLSGLNRKQYGALPLADEGSAPPAPSASASSSLLPPAYDSSAAAPPDYGEVVPVDEFGEFSSRIEMSSGRPKPSTEREQEQEQDQSSTSLRQRVDNLVNAALRPTFFHRSPATLQPLLSKNEGRLLERSLHKPDGQPFWSQDYEGLFRRRSRHQWEDLVMAGGVLGCRLLDLEAQKTAAGWWNKPRLMAEISLAEEGNARIAKEYGLVLYYLRRIYWVFERKHGVEPHRIMARLDPFLGVYEPTLAERDAHERKDSCSGPTTSVLIPKTVLTLLSQIIDFPSSAPSTPDRTNLSSVVAQT